jgi:regulatory protein
VGFSTSPEADRALTVALRLLSIRARGQKEMADRLRRKGFEARVVAQVLQELTARRLLDDELFARGWIRTRVLTRQLGRRRLADELREKGVPEEIVGTVLQEAFQEVSEEEVARQAAEKRFRLLTHLSVEVIRRRLTGYLLRRGFPREMVERLVSSLVRRKD